MACSVVRSPLLRNQTVRHYAVAAAAQAQASCPGAIQTQVLDNKVTATAIENNSPISQVTIIFRAGSRNETYETQGLAHHLRVAAGLGTKGASCFGITRNIQQLGGNLTATVDRESVAYTLQITKDNLGNALKYLEDMATKQAFKPWEVSDQIPRIRYEISSVPDTVKVIELLHKVAFRSGLGYSLYSPKRQLGKIGSETLQHFVNTYFTGSRCGVVASGMSMSDLCEFARNLTVSSADCQDPATKYHGGEIRKDRDNEVATVALAAEGAALSNDKDALAYAVLQRAVGSGPRVKWGSTAATTSRKILAAAGNEPCAVTGFNASYTDAGLFGFIVCGPSQAAGAAAKAARKWLKSPELTDEDISRGKALLKAEILGAADQNSGLVDELSQQLIYRGKVTTAVVIATEVDKLSASDVKAAATKLSNKPLSMVSIGDLQKVPYLDELN